MRRFASVLLLAVSVLVMFPLSFAQSAPPASLRVLLPEEIFTGPDRLVPSNGTAPAPSTCGPQLTATSQASVTQKYSTAVPPVNGTYWRFDDPGNELTLTLVFTGSNQPTQTSYRSFGFNVTVEIKAGAASFGKASQAVPAGTQDPTSITLKIPPPAGNASLGSGPLSADVTLAAQPQAPGIPGIPGQTQSVALRCGASKINTFTIVRGPPGDGDLDADGISDTQDQDVDGDNIPNAQEAAVQCTIKGNKVDFSRSPATTPGDHDGDGASDEEECRKGSDPLDAASTPAPPKPLPWGLIIFGFLLLAAIALAIFFFTVYGKAVAVTVVSMSELVVPAGTQGKYQLQVQNLKKKGNPINFQLAAQGLPDGWDAKLQPDHAVLDPVGGAKNIETVWLHVESPQHSDPESAVVKVKAIPLNAAGRKDTLKLPAAARTITSINVPPNAKVPVKRGAPVKLKSEKELAKEVAAGQPVPETAPTPVASAPVAEEPARKGKKEKKGKAPEPTPPPVAPPPPAATPPPAGKPALQVGGLTHSPPSFAAGQDVKSMVTVTNNGDDSQTLKLSLFVNEALADAQTVSVKPGKSKEVKFKWTAQERNKLNIRGELVAG